MCFGSLGASAESGVRGNHVIRATMLTCACKVEVRVGCMISECQYVVDEYGRCGGGGGGGGDDGGDGGGGGGGGGGDGGGFSLQVRSIGKVHRIFHAPLPHDPPVVVAVVVV